jgi:hypothetical protein
MSKELSRLLDSFSNNRPNILYLKISTYIPVLHISFTHNKGRLRMCRAISPFPLMSSWDGAVYGR